MRADGRRAGAWRGQSTLEFAITSLLLLTMIFGTIDLGRAVFTRTMLTNAVREATRQGTLTPNDKSKMADAATARSPTLTFTASMLEVSCFTWSDSSLPCVRKSGLGTPGVAPYDKIKVCTNYTQSLIATRLIGFSSITYRECQQASIQ